MTDTVNVSREVLERIEAHCKRLERDGSHTVIHGTPSAPTGERYYNYDLARDLRSLLAATPKAEPVHDSDCALHNEPAYPNGPCDCAAKPVATLDEDDVKRARELRHDPDSEDNERFSSWFGDTLLDVHEAYVKMVTHPEAPKVEQEPAAWVRAVDEELVSLHLGVANADDTYEEAKQKLQSIIKWNVQVLTDPALNPTPASDELLEALEGALDWIDALPEGVASDLAMPGFDRDWVNDLIAKHKGAAVVIHNPLDAALDEGFALGQSAQIETPRDRFAMAALVGLLASPDTAPTFKEASAIAFDIADFMMEARK